MKSLLLMSSSKSAKSPSFLEHGLNWLKEHFQDRKVLFIPYAGVSMTHQNYSDNVSSALSAADIETVGIERFSSPVKAVENAEAIAVGGGNTFMLLHLIYENSLYDALKAKIQSGTPYAGWSAGSNIVGPTIRTTNDMPIIQPRSFNALAGVPFQLNPHFTNAMPPGHRGETRSQRIHEFMHVDMHTPVLGIAEGTALKVKDRSLEILGEDPATLFENMKERLIQPRQDLSYLL